VADYAPTMSDWAAALTREADLTDWIEQHCPVSLPEDEYPHVDIRTAIGR
jgi:hypothetical protein